MAEYVCKDMVKKEGLEQQFYIDSAATSQEEIGNPVHDGTRNKLEEMKIPCGNHRAKRITKQDYDKFDYIIGMEERNVEDIKRIIGNDTENKICKLLDFSNYPRNIADPWYTGDFDTTYHDIVEGLQAFLKYIGANNEIKKRKS